MGEIAGATTTWAHYDYPTKKNCDSRALWCAVPTSETICVETEPIDTQGEKLGQTCRVNLIDWSPLCWLPDHQNALSTWPSLKSPKINCLESEFWFWKSVKIISKEWNAIQLRLEIEWFSNFYSAGQSIILPADQVGKTPDCDVDKNKIIIFVIHLILIE